MNSFSQEKRSSFYDILSIVIITVNSKSQLKRCLESIYTNVKYPFELILVDNGSTDGTVDMVRHEFPEVRVLRNRRNRGVAPARNQGLAVCKGRYILILDDDTYVIDGAIDRIVEFMSKRPVVGVCGAKLLNARGELIHSCRRFPTLSSSILNRIVKIADTESPLPLRRHLMIDWAHDQPSVVDYMAGACQLINRQALIDVGPYDKSIFYGPEDLEFCFRMWKRGWEVWYVPDAHVVHDWRRSTKKNPVSMLAIRHFLAVLRMHLQYRFRDFRHVTEATDRRRSYLTKQH
ncbi:MAG: glycosyltransferase family 2 protein [candidate division WOR-3 bacterium]|nr:glycosyltransferase family 2 protein [candidate division WOR-3 bacterium]